ncbi:hypothetical protein ACFSL6_17850 [Paenibacillus thailandensis]|uniref:Holliday junction nuclease RuvC n=1 Tax=Paenibacillus thailandensis TaxID=393250 RepID=A0ABW5R310_9BACL
MRFIGLDPSTKTGFVALNTAGEVLEAKELTGAGKEDPARMASLIETIMRQINPDDMVCIEGFGFASQQAVQLGGIGWGIRMALYRRGILYQEASPSQVKKFATGKGNTPKDGMPVPIFKRWGFEHKSNNVTDAFVIAQIGRALTLPGLELTKYQTEVIQAIRAK